MHISMTSGTYFISTTTTTSEDSFIMLATSCAMSCDHKLRELLANIYCDEQGMQSMRRGLEVAALGSVEQCKATWHRYKRYMRMYSFYTDAV